LLNLADRRVLLGRGRLVHNVLLVGVVDYNQYLLHWTAASRLDGLNRGFDRLLLGCSSATSATRSGLCSFGFKYQLGLDRGLGGFIVLNNLLWLDDGCLWGCLTTASDWCRLLRGLILIGLLCLLLLDLAVGSASRKGSGVFGGLLLLSFRLLLYLNLASGTRSGYSRFFDRSFDRGSAAASTSHLDLGLGFGLLRLFM
jgi:hypothetical protein